jgi:DNA-binding NarL/FixJ family response regulator
MEQISLVIVDDHPIFRQGVVDTLSLETDFSVFGEAETGEEALDMIRTLRPQIAVIDVNLPGMNGQQLTRQIVNEKLPTKVILLTAYDDDEQKIHSMRAGAAAYCVKDVKPETLVQIVREVQAGKFVIGEQLFDLPTLERWIAPQAENAMRPYSDPGEPFQPLSGREMEVLSQLTMGLSNKEIASLLGISHQTVKNHVTAILRKLGVEDRTQAAVYALRRGWVRLHQPTNDPQE